MLHPTSSRRRARSCAALALLLLPACAGPGDEPEGDSRRADGVLTATQVIALRSYWNGAAGDNALSTDPSFAAAGYAPVRVEGYLLRPEVPPRAGTRPVYTWYSSARGDYFTTTNPAWAAGLPGETRAGYTFVRMEGYAFNEPAAGTAPLQLWWSAGRADNHSTTDPAWASPTPATRAPDYAFAATLGHVVVQDPEGPAASRDAFHFGTMGPGAAERSVFVLMGSYRDAPMRHTRAQEDALFFGPAAPNARDYANEMSGGAFRWARGGLQGYAITDDPDTHADEALWGVNQDMANPVMAYALLDHTDATTTGVTRIGCRDGGGGALFNSPGADAWETLGLDDLNGAALYSGESVRFKCFGGQFIASDGARLVGTGTSATAARFIVESATGPGVVHNGEGVRLRLPSGQYVAPDLSLTTVLANASLFTLHKTQPDVSRQLRGALREAAAAGVNFAGFDRDLDGVVRRAELTFALVIAGPSHTLQIGAATRNVGVFAVPGSSLRLEPGQALVAGEDVALASLEHELTHTLGAYDLYGAAALNDRATLMGPTIVPTRDERDAYHLDPWHKMQLGWVSPRIVAVTSNGGAARLDAPSLGGAAMTDAKRPLLVFDPARYDLGRRSGEFFLVEHRDPSAGGYDANAAPSGVVIWQVSTDENGAPRTVASTSVPGGLDSTVNTLGAPGLTRGGTTAWTSADGLITPTWLDGTSAPFSLRVAPRTTAGVVWVEWSRTGTLTARLDTTVASAQRGGVLSVGGVFPVASAAASVALLDDLGRAFPLAVTVWDGATIRGTVPTAAPAGNLRVVVRNGATTSISLPVTIR